MLNEPIYPSWMYAGRKASASKPSITGSVGKKVVSPGHKCQIAGIFVNRGLCSERAACRHFGLHRSTFQYEAKQPNAWLARLKIALKRMSRLHPELGYSKITRLLKDEGWQVGNRMVQRLRREVGPGCPNQEASQEASGHLYWPTDQGYAPQPRLDLGLRPRHHDAGRQAAHAYCSG